MSGYGNRAEAMGALKGSLAMNAGSWGINPDPKRYYMARVFDECFWHAGRNYGWRLTDTGFSESATRDCFLKHSRH